jgi:hypothetical protein
MHQNNRTASMNEASSKVQGSMTAVIEILDLIGYYFIHMYSCVMRTHSHQLPCSTILYIVEFSVAIWFLLMRNNLIAIAEIQKLLRVESALSVLSVEWHR